MAKIPVILEAGRADGKLIKTNSVYDDNQEKFLSDKIKEIDNNHNTLDNTVRTLTETVNNNELDIENKLEAEQTRATDTENNLRETINNITEISGSATTANVVTIDTIPNSSASNVQQALTELFKNDDEINNAIAEEKSAIMGTDRIADRAVTTSKLSTDIQSLISNLSKTSTFAGIATPTTNPGTPDGLVFYIATKAGTYSNFNDIELLEGESAIIKWNNRIWAKSAFKPMTDFNSVFDANGKSLSYKLSELEEELTIKGEGFDWKVGYVADNGQVSISEDKPNSFICLEPKIYTEDKSYTIPDGMILIVKKGSSSTSLSTVAQGSASNFEMIIKNDGQYTAYNLKYNDLSDISPSKGINAAPRTKRLDDIDNRLGGLSVELNDLKVISTYQEEYVLDNAVSQLTDASVSSRGIIESYASYSIKLYKLAANKKYFIRRKVEWSGVILGYVAQFDIDNFVVGGSATSLIIGSTKVLEKEVTYTSDTYISILSKDDRGTFYEIVEFNDKGIADVKQDLESITTDLQSITTDLQSITTDLQSITTDLQSIEKVVRKSIVIKRTDDNIQLYDKLLTAYNTGNTDVFFETCVYELTSVYIYMKDTLGYTSMYEMQIGNGCRYFLNGSTLISKHIDGIPNNDRSVFGTRMKSSDYEIYDGILITDGGHYVVHDDTQNYNQQYRHVYKNITFKTTNDEGVRTPEAPLGCGTGKYVDTIFEDCIFDSFGDTDFFCHGIINDTHQKVTLRLTFSNCFFSKFVGLSGYLTNEDDIKLVVNNCSLGRVDTIQHENKCKYLHMYNNQVRD